MMVEYLLALSSIVEQLLGEECTKDIISNLKREVKDTKEPFIWHVLDVEHHRSHLPPPIKSAWLFALRENTPSIAHCHPNSIQHTAIIEGKGEVRVGERHEALRLFDARDVSTWYVIGKNVPHEFFPATEMIVISFHTCLPHELVEIAYVGGRRRKYE